MRVELPPLAQHDDPLALRVHGAPKNAEVLIEVRATDSSRSGWFSSAVFTASPDGFVDPSVAASHGGSYRGVEELGLLWSLGSGTGSFVPFSPQWLRMTVIARCGEAEAKASGTRCARLPGVEHLSVQPPINGEYFRPANARRLPAVVVIGGSEQPAPTLHAGLLAGNGFAVLALPTFFGVSVESLQAATRWLLDRPEVMADRVGILGLSNGVTAAILLATRLRETAALVALSGSCVSLPIRAERKRPAVTVGGRPIPQLRAGGSFMSYLRGSFHPTGAGMIDEMLETAPNVEEAILPLDQIDAPILIAAGELDEEIPVSAVRIGSRRREMKPHPDDAVLIYDDAGHITDIPGLPSDPAFQRPRIPWLPYSLGGAPRSNAKAITDVWAGGMALFAKHVGRPVKVARDHVGEEDRTGSHSGGPPWN